MMSPYFWTLAILFLDNIFQIASSDESVLQHLNAFFGNFIGSEVDPEVYMNATEIILKYGFVAEEHDVITPDGYVLCLIRMRKPEFLFDIAPRGVVLLQHGLLDSAHTWIANLRNESLGFILADADYDVWLGNSRGNTYSRKHIHLDPSQSKFWDFSWDQMAKYDLSSSIRYILNYTGVEKMGYIGHSQGTQIAFAQFDVDPELQKHICIFIALAPVAYLGHLKSPIRYLVPFAQTIRAAVYLFGHGEFMPSSWLIKFLSKILCYPGQIPKVCENVIFLFAGFDSRNINVTRIPVYIAHTPAGTSAQNVVHYCQAIKTNRFQHFDYGFIGNLLRYGTLTPPRYQLGSLNIPVALFNGGSDLLSDPRDVDRLLAELGSTVHHSFHPAYNHLDFVWGMDAARAIYPTVLDLLQRYA